MHGLIEAYIYTLAHAHIYIYRERERERCISETSLLYLFIYLDKLYCDFPPYIAKLNLFLACLDFLYSETLCF